MYVGVDRTEYDMLDTHANTSARAKKLKEGKSTDRAACGLSFSYSVFRNCSGSKDLALPGLPAKGQLAVPTPICQKLILLSSPLFPSNVANIIRASDWKLRRELLLTGAQFNTHTNISEQFSKASEHLGT